MGVGGTKVALLGLPQLPTPSLSAQLAETHSLPCVAVFRGERHMECAYSAITRPDLNIFGSILYIF